MRDKIRPNVLYLATLAGVMTLVFGIMLIRSLAGETVATEILALLVGIGIGGIMTIAGQVATDPPPPSVPAETHERMMKEINNV